MMNILEVIDKIVSDEIKKSDYDLNTIDFAVNVTGGTNIMASGATLAAMLTGTKAYYVQDSRIGPKRKEICRISSNTSNQHYSITKQVSPKDFANIRKRSI